MKTKVFFDLHHARQWLLHSVVTYQGRPVFISAVDSCNKKDHFKLCFIELLSPDGSAVDYFPSKKFDLTPVPLGLMNYRSGVGKPSRAILATRSPYRQWSIGLSRMSLNLSLAVAGSSSPLMTSNLTPYVLKSKDLADCILGKYPSYEEVRELSRRSAKLSMAFSRRFCIANKNQVFFAGIEEEPVGESKTDGIDLYDDYFYLNEVAKEEVA